MTDFLNPNQTDATSLNNLQPLPTNPIATPQIYPSSPIINTNVPKKNLKPFIIIGIVILLVIIGFVIFNSFAGNNKSTNSASTTKNSTIPVANNSADSTTSEDKSETYYKYRFGNSCDYNGTERAINFSATLDKISDDSYFASYSISLSGKDLAKIKGNDGLDLIKKDASGDFVGVYNSEIKLRFSIIDKKLVTVKITEKNDPIIENCLKSINYELPFITFSSYGYFDHERNVLKEGTYLSEDNNVKLQISQKSHVGFVAAATDIKSGKTCSSYLKQTNTWAEPVGGNFIYINQKTSTDNINVSLGERALKEKCGINLVSEFFKPNN